MMLLWKRFVASVLDKIAILIIFVLVMLFIQYTPYTASGHMGRYIGMMSIPPSHYDNIDKVPKERESKTIEISEYYQKQEAYNLSKEGKQTCLVLDLTITIWFIIINVLYYLLSELIVGASFFKALLGGKLYDYDGELVNINIENLGHCEIRHIRTRSRQRGRGAKILERGREKKY